MKEVKAYIRTKMLDDVIDALHRVSGLSGYAVYRVEQFGHEVTTGDVKEVEMTKIELIVKDEMVDAAVATLVDHARTGHGHYGDGRVIVVPVADAVRIADGIHGEPILD